MYFDCHCHLHFRQFDEDRQEIIDRLTRENVGVINSTTDPSQIQAGLEVSRNPNVWWTLGLKASCLEEKKVDETLTLLQKYGKKIVGVGEVGMDYHHVKKKDKREAMKENFKKFIEYSIDSDKPLVVHSRDAEKYVIELLGEYDKPALLHCFSGNLDLAKRAVDLGCLISIPASIAYSSRKKELAREIPVENLVLETDSPYQSPQPKTRNTPFNVKETSRIIADLKETAETRIQDATRLNACRFFGIQ